MSGTELFQKIAEAYEGNLDALDEVCAEGYVNHDPFGGDMDVEAEKELIRSYHESFDDIRLELVDMIEQGDRLCWRYRATGTHTGPFMGIQGTGSRNSIEGVGFAHLEDGKVKETWTIFDTLGFLRMLGFPESMREEPRPSA